MKALFVLVCWVALGTSAIASPFLVSDPNPTAIGGWSEIVGASWVPSPVALQADGSIRVDVAAAPVGRSDVQVRVCVDDSTWGVQCSDYVPFGFVRPGPPSAAGSLRLVK